MDAFCSDIAKALRAPLLTPEEWERRAEEQALHEQEEQEQRQKEAEAKRRAEEEARRRRDAPTRAKSLNISTIDSRGL
jgi:hypothetical protein